MGQPGGVIRQVSINIHLEFVRDVDVWWKVHAYIGGK